MSKAKKINKKPQPHLFLSLSPKFFYLLPKMKGVINMKVSMPLGVFLRVLHPQKASPPLRNKCLPVPWCPAYQRLSCSLWIPIILYWTECPWELDAGLCFAVSAFTYTKKVWERVHAGRLIKDPFLHLWGPSAEKLKLRTILLAGSPSYPSLFRVELPFG